MPPELHSGRKRSRSMSVETVQTPNYSPARERGYDGTSLLSFPVLEARGRRAGRGHPFWIYVSGVLLSFVVIAALSIVAGLLITHVVLRAHGVAGDDERFVRFLARHRSG